MLFEIGTEELPAAYLPGLIEQLAQEAARLLSEQHLACRSIESFGAPRRLVLLVRGLSAVQRKPAEEIRGPSQQAAYDAKGQPTQALLGFLRSRGGRLEQTKLVKTDKGAYVYLTKPATTVPTVSVLPAILAQLIERLRAPKTMRWDASNVRFARPIRWLVACYGAAPLRVRVGSLASGTQTWIGRAVERHSVRVTSPAAYLAALAKSGVRLDHRQRRAWIASTVAKLAAKAGGHPAAEIEEYGLLEEVTHLVEQPVSLVGTFDRTYLQLPRELLLASMAKYQRVFAIESKGGALLPQFVAILDGTPKRPGEVRNVCERILNARLADSLMFWTEDRKRTLPGMAAELSGVIFHEKLGSMADKTKRLLAMAEPLASAWSLADGERRTLRRASELAKADLMSTLVREFPTLQGIMGRYLAREAGEPSEVAEAIGEQYLPAAGHLPATLIGNALALLDKYDTLTSYFGLGIEPTGDQDPFGLRRAAQGIVEIAWKVHRPLPLEALFAVRAADPPFHTDSAEAPRMATRIRQYLFERLYTFAWPRPTPPTDYIDAVLASPCDDLVDAMDRIRSLQQLDGDPALLKAAKVVERTSNILKGTAAAGEVNPERFQDPLERKLWELYRANEPRLAKLAQEKQYADATTAFGEVFHAPLHEFFDRVMVNVPEEVTRHNRLALMRAIHALYTERVADLSKLTVLQKETP